MKLRNKKTGESGYYLHTHRDYKNGRIKVAVLKDGEPFSEFKPYEPIYDYDSLAELNEEWEDYEEDEYYYAITSIKHDGGITKMKNKHNDMTAYDKSIGNYFETRKEAEAAVRKLKAWKRLRKNHFKFDEYDILNQTVTWLVSREYDQYENDIKLLFGGEE